MFKFVTIYRQVNEREALDKFFSGPHLPLAERLPGLLHREVSHIAGKPGGKSRFLLMFELYFESQLAFKQALASPVGEELMLALKPWGEARIITWFYADSVAEAMDTPPPLLQAPPE